MVKLETIIKDIENNLRQWSGLYSNHDLEKAKANLHYLKELQQIKGGTK